MRENTVEKALNRRCKEEKWLCLKMTAASGIPDRLLVLPGGRVVWVEVKRPGGKPRLLQEGYHKKLRGMGHPVFVVDSVDGVNELMENLSE